jgi:hypothetical protein
MENKAIYFNFVKDDVKIMSSVSDFSRYDVQSQLNLLEVVCQWGSITEETNLKYYHMFEGVYNWTIYKSWNMNTIVNEKWRDME